MQIETFNTMNLIPIGKVYFKWSRKFKIIQDRQDVYIGDVHIMCETDRHIKPETEKALLKMMKEAESDLLTDGRDFFTTRGTLITQIKHGGFESIMNIHKEEIHKLLYK